MSAIQASNLTKKYKKTLALRGLDFEVETGGVLGLLGPKGAGKTTAIRLLSGLEEPTVGDSTVLGFSSYKETEKLHAAVGVMTEEAHGYGHLSALENLLFYGSLYGVPTARVKERAAVLLRQLELWNVRDTRSDSFSKGMQRRLSLARTLIHSPRVLLLDEPTTNIDPFSVSAMEQAIQNVVRDEEVTVLLTCGHLPTAKNLCDRFAVLDKGVLRATGTFPDLCRAAETQITAVVHPAASASLPAGFVQVGRHFEREIGAEEDMPSLIAELVRDGVPISEVYMRRPTLETVYKTLVGEQLKEDANAE